MINLKDVTFLIPFRYDSEERLRNLRAVIDFLNYNTDTNIIVMEEAPERKFTDQGKFLYEFVHNPGPMMYRTRCLNRMAKMAKTPIIVIQDTDALIPPHQLEQAAQAIRLNQLDMVYPYNGRFINFLEPIISQIIQNKTLAGVSEEQGHLIHPASLGGSIFFNRAKFILGGMENENFVSWGWEDNERIHRFQMLGNRVSRIHGILFHLHHPPSTNSANTSHDAYKNNEQEFIKVRHMNRDQLAHYISTWSWLK
jgi:predicted glycosyltransferase involved in capsule biosynthesis